MKIIMLIYLALIVFPWAIYPAILALFRKPTEPTYDIPTPNRWLILTAGRNVAERGVAHVHYLEQLCVEHGNAHAVYIDDRSDGAEAEDLTAWAELNKLEHVDILHGQYHAGKENALTGALRYAGDGYTRVLFVDVGVRLWVGGEQDDILEGLDYDTYFRLPEVGGIAFSDDVEKPGLYLRLEMAIRNLESHAGGLVGAGGMGLAMKADAMPATFEAPCDLTMARVAMQKGFWIMHGGRDYQAVYTKPLNGAYQRAVRTAMRGMAGVEFVKGEHWWNFKLLCHKHLRWLSSILIALNPVAWLLLIVRPSIIRPHLAILHAAVLTLSGKRITKWEGTKR